MEKNWNNSCLWMGLGIDLEGTQGNFQDDGNILELQRDLIFTFDALVKTLQMYTRYLCTLLCINFPSKILKM